MDNYSYQLNGSDSLHDFQLLSSAECIALPVVFGIESVVTVTLNFLTIIVYLRERSLRKPNMYLVTNLAVADMFNGGLSIVTVLYVFNSKRLCHFPWFNDEDMYTRILLLITFFFINSSLGSLPVISLERLHATFRPFKHRLIKSRIYGAAISVIWITAGVCAISFFSKISYYALLFFWSFCFLIILVAYSSIAIKLYCGRYPQHHGGGRRERKLTKILFIVTSVSLVLALPFIIVSFAAMNSLPFFVFFPFPKPIYLVLPLFFLFQANSLVNPLLYALRMPGFKRALLSLLACRSQPAPIQDFPLNAL